MTGVERPIIFDVPAMNGKCEIVHSLAKWKRMALKEYNFNVGEGLYTDMNAIRRDEELGNLHSLYVDQWDWERIITERDRNLDFLIEIVNKIYFCLKETEKEIKEAFPILEWELPDQMAVITTQELEDLYPDLDPKAREHAIAKDKKAVFLTQIGGKLKSGTMHDRRAPDYDDWNLNGDILVWHPILEQAVELSSMGIRVDEAALLKQLKAAGCEHWAEYKFHKELLAGNLPLTIGGGLVNHGYACIFLKKFILAKYRRQSGRSILLKRAEKTTSFYFKSGRRNWCGTSCYQTAISQS